MLARICLQANDKFKAGYNISTVRTHVTDRTSRTVQGNVIYTKQSRIVAKWCHFCYDL